ncbi:MAG: DsrE family protein [Pseudomonadota bacterium]
MPVQGRPLIWLSNAPYAGARMRAGIDTAMAFAAFAQNPQVLVSGTGVLALLRRETEPDYKEPSLRKLVDSLPLYDVETVWVDAASLVAYGITRDELPAFAQCLDAGAVRALLDDASHLFCY